MYRAAWIFYLLLAVGGVVWIGLREGRIGLELFVDPAGWWIDLGLGVGAAAVLLGLWEIGRRSLAGAKRLEAHVREALGPLDRSEVFALALLSGFAEELFFRGAVQPSWGLLAATLLFALLHIGPGRVFYLWTLFAAVAGLTFGLLMEHRGNLLAPAVGHFLVNWVNLRYLSRTEPASPG